MGSQGQLCLPQETHGMVHLGGLISHLMVPLGGKSNMAQDM
jgi:hypothetical protein